MWLMLKWWTKAIKNSRSYGNKTTNSLISLRNGFKESKHVVLLSLQISGLKLRIWARVYACYKGVA